MHTEPDQERIAKYLAHAGIASRRHAEDLITSGHVTVNGSVTTNLATRIHPAHDIVTIDGKPVRSATRTVTAAIYKPVGYVSTASDPQGRPIVGDLLPPELRAQRLVPVGRLDLDSEGLMLLSNDGELALHLTHPRYETEKEYHALIRGHLDDDDLQQLRQGVIIAQDDRPTAPAIVWRIEHTYQAERGYEWIGLIIHEGRKRQVREMVHAVGGRVVQLVRVRIGQLWLGDIAEEPGDFTILDEDMITLARTNGHSPRS